MTPIELIDRLVACKSEPELTDLWKDSEAQALVAERPKRSMWFGHRRMSFITDDMRASVMGPAFLSAIEKDPSVFHAGTSLFRISDPVWMPTNSDGLPGFRFFVQQRRESDEPDFTFLDAGEPLPLPVFYRLHPEIERWGGPLDPLTDQDLCP